jgi:hypothetical protein
VAVCDLGEAGPASATPTLLRASTAAQTNAPSLWDLTASSNAQCLRPSSAPCQALRVGLSRH